MLHLGSDGGGWVLSRRQSFGGQKTSSRRLAWNPFGANFGMVGWADGVSASSSLRLATPGKPRGTLAPVILRKLAWNLRLHPLGSPLGRLLPPMHPPPALHRRLLVHVPMLAPHWPHHLIGLVPALLPHPHRPRLRLRRLLPHPLVDAGAPLPLHQLSPLPRPRLCCPVDHPAPAGSTSQTVARRRPLLLPPRRLMICMPSCVVSVISWFR